MAVISVGTVEIGLVATGDKVSILEDSPGLRALNIAMIRLRADPARVRTGQEIVVSQLGSARRLSDSDEVSSFAAGFMNWLRIGGTPTIISDSYLCDTAFDDDQLVLPSMALEETAQLVAAASPATTDDLRPARHAADRVVAEWDRLVASGDQDGAVAYATKVIHERLETLR